MEKPDELIKKSEGHERSEAQGIRKIPDWYVLRCGCDTFVTDYPFLHCNKCGFINCGSKKQLDDAKEKGYLMVTLKAGFGEPDTQALSEELGVPVRYNCDNLHPIYRLSEVE